MNQKNFDYLKDQVKFTGFGEALESDLKERMQRQTPEFKVYYNTQFGKEIVVASLHFKKSEQSDMYFFNKYNLRLKQEDSSDIIEQTFYINKASSITLKEAYNLMSGRAVNKDLTSKEGQLYNAWVQMDFRETDNNGNYRLKQYHSNYGFDLDKELSKHPIKELTNDQDKARLIDSLNKGNRQLVTFVKDNKEQKMFIEANPRFKTVNAYDSNMQRSGNRQTKDEKQEVGESVTPKQEVKKESKLQGDDDDTSDLPKLAKKKTKKQSPTL